MDPRRATTSRRWPFGRCSRHARPPARPPAAAAADALPSPLPLDAPRPSQAEIDARAKEASWALAQLDDKGQRAQYGPRPLVPQLVFEHSDAEARRAFANGGELPVRKPRKGAAVVRGRAGERGAAAARPDGPRARPRVGRRDAARAAEPQGQPQVGDGGERVADAALDGEGSQKAASRSMSPATLPLN